MAKSPTKIFYRHPEFVSPLGMLGFADSLFDPVPQKGGPPKFRPMMIYPKSEKKAFLAVIKTIIMATPNWAEKGLVRFENKAIKNPLLEDTGPDTDSPARNAEDEFHPGMSKDVFFIRPSSGEGHPPFIIWKTRDAKGKWVMETKESGTIYSGCKGKMTLQMYSYNHPDGGDGIAVTVIGFQKFEEGERIGGGGGSSVDPSRFAETIADEGPAPEATRSGGGAGSLFDD